MDSMFSMMDDKMKEAYLNGQLQFSKGKIVIEGQEIDMVEMNKGEVMSSNFNKLFDVIKQNAKREDKGFASIFLTIGGWDDVPEPIYEIMEIRRFYMKLYRKMPHFLFYVSPIRQTPHFILACLSDIEVKARHGKWASPMELAKEEGHSGNIGSTSVEIRMDGKIGYNMINAIREHAEKVGFVDEGEELPVIYKTIESFINKDERLNKNKG